MSDEDIKKELEEIRFKLRIDDAIRDITGCFVLFVISFVVISAAFYLKG